MYIYIYVCMYMYMYMYDGYTTSILPFLLGKQLSVPSFEKGGSEETTVCHSEYLTSCQKTTFKDKICL